MCSCDSSITFREGETSCFLLRPHQNGEAVELLETARETGLCLRNMKTSINTFYKVLNICLVLQHPPCHHDISKDIFIVCQFSYTSWMLFRLIILVSWVKYICIVWLTNICKVYHFIMWKVCIYASFLNEGYSEISSVQVRLSLEVLSGNERRWGNNECYSNFVFFLWKLLLR